MRQPVETKITYDFSNKLSVITKIEKDFINVDVIKNEDTLQPRDKTEKVDRAELVESLNQSLSKSSHLKNRKEYTSETLIKRYKEQDMKKLDEKIKKIKKKKRLTDYIIVKLSF